MSLKSEQPRSCALGSRQVMLVYNRQAGKHTKNSDYLKELQQQLAMHGLLPKIIAVDQLQELAANSVADQEVVIAVGGDGTVRSVVEKFIEHDIILGIIPAGTYNHLARDLNIPLTMAESIAVIAKGVTKQIDVAQVNDSIFLNNSSIGLYTKAVKFRQAYPSWMKWFATMMAAFNVFRRLPLFKVDYHLKGKEVEVITPLVFIANNQYDLELLKLTQRKQLDEGLLYLYLNQSQSHWDFVKLLFNVILRRQKKIRGKFSTIATESCRLYFQKKDIDVAVDGEVKCMATPLTYKTHPKKLTIIIPEEEL